MEGSLATAVILAGGLGTRLRPLTLTTPKPLLPVKGKPIMQYSIENLKKYGISDITLAISYMADKIEEYFGDGSKFGVKLKYSIETEPLGTGGAVKQAICNIDKDFVLIWGDNLMDVNISELVEQHKKYGQQITMTLTPREDVENFGVAVLEGDKIVGFVEKPKRAKAPSKMINAGAFVIKPEALAILPEGKSNIERECFQKLATEKGGVVAYIHNGQWFPTDTLEKYHFAQKMWKGL